MKTSLVVALLSGLLALIVVVSISPLFETAQETAACFGADDVQRDVSSGGDVQSAPTGADTERPTTVFELLCTWDDGEVREVGNDEAVLKGIGLAFLGGALLGLAVLWGHRLWGRLRAEA